MKKEIDTTQLVDNMNVAVKAAMGIFENVIRELLNDAMHKSNKNEDFLVKSSEITLVTNSDRKGKEVKQEDSNPSDDKEKIKDEIKELLDDIFETLNEITEETKK